MIFTYLLEKNYIFIFLESVKRFKSQSTETEIINTIKLWLVRSKDRHENSEKRQLDEQNVRLFIFLN